MNRRAYSVTTPSKFMSIRPTPLPYALDAPSMCSTQVDPRSGSGVVSSFIVLSSVSSGLLSNMVHSMIKSARTCTFMDGHG